MNKGDLAMKPTAKVSTLRANGFSIFNCTGFTCRITSNVPFVYGERVVNQKAEQGDYRITVRGHYKTELPKQIYLI